MVTVSANPTSGVAPLPVSFSQTSSDPDGSIASYSWTFGDGQTSTGTIVANGAGGFDVHGTNAYAIAGQFSVTVQVLEAFGARLGGLQASEEITTGATNVTVVFAEVLL